MGKNTKFGRKGELSSAVLVHVPLDGNGLGIWPIYADPFRFIFDANPFPLSNMTLFPFSTHTKTLSPYSHNP
jgi:hypothetical protein